MILWVLAAQISGYLLLGIIKRLEALHVQCLRLKTQIETWRGYAVSYLCRTQSVTVSSYVQVCVRSSCCSFVLTNSLFACSLLGSSFATINMQIRLPIFTINFFNHFVKEGVIFIYRLRAQPAVEGAQSPAATANLRLRLAASRWTTLICISG